MTVPRLNMMSEYWASHPPTHEMVAAYLGFKTKTQSEAEDKKNQQAFLAELIGAAPGARMKL